MRKNKVSYPWRWKLLIFPCVCFQCSLILQAWRGWKRPRWPHFSQPVPEKNQDIYMALVPWQTEHIIRPLPPMPTAWGAHALLKIRLTSSSPVWKLLGFGNNSIWLHPLGSRIYADMSPEVLCTILWKIWDSRNAALFRNEDHYHLVTIQNICKVFEFWNSE